MTVNVGDFVAIKGDQRSCYVVNRIDEKGHVHMYGGDPDPKGRRGWRVVKPSSLKPALAKHRPKAPR